MLEIKVTVELPGIPEALNNLADAIREMENPPRPGRERTQKRLKSPPLSRKARPRRLRRLNSLNRLPACGSTQSGTGTLVYRQRSPDEEPVPAIPSAPVPAPIPAPVPVAAPEPAPVKSTRSGRFPRQARPLHEP